MGRCLCGHHEEDHEDDRSFTCECLVEDCGCMDFQPEDEEDYDDSEPVT
jgi:hypothetical protein